MKGKAGSYRIVDLPRARRETPHFVDLFWWKHCMYALLEIDVTVVKQFIEDYKARTGEQLSFTGYIVYCVGQAVAEDTSVHAILKGRKQLVVYDDVGVGLTVERQIEGTKAVMGHVIRKANRKTFMEIHQEIRAIQSTPVPAHKGMPGIVRWALQAPWPVPSLFKAGMRYASRRDPTMIASMGGTVLVTAVGMFGEGQGGWGLLPMPASLSLIIGSTAWKPAVVDRQIVPREILNLTIVFDHDVIDGGPAARFSRRLVEMIEAGHGLQAEPAPVG